MEKKYRLLIKVNSPVGEFVGYSDPSNQELQTFEECNIYASNIIHNIVNRPSWIDLFPSDSDQIFIPETVLLNSILSFNIVDWSNRT